ncbi:DtxR family Mn-dependent transcriptional regulator [Arcanobacterium pluranimalium]|uniref:metal-dependent transcriptional regulator n=1 Tax=Arcanobacterium pluranimalium TaxID=108028 RepID=UPI00195C5212|nr:metal-dependent transcriptional regulator [Arcanobacterium pluranimalium]MBM7825254.1 DtxR family Mn-dependent transcriptional regulator [Arcanobacterium pluranimalium]
MNLSASHEDYLKAVWMISERNSGHVAPKDIAQQLSLSPSTVSEGIKRLVAMGLVLHDRYGDVSLTPEGRTIGVEMVRKHRLIETFLVDELGYSWDEVHTEAESLEHAVSDLFISRIDERLGFPHRDPHGDPIPRADGTTHPVRTENLAQQCAGSQAMVVRVADHDPELLTYVAEIGLVPGTSFEVTSVSSSLGLMSLNTSARSVQLPLTVAEQIWVSALPTE